MMDPAKPGGRPRPQLSPKQRTRTASDEGLARKWDPQPNISPLIALNSRSTSPPPQSGKRAPDPFTVEHAKLYPSYVVETGTSHLPYEAHVQGWLFAPGVNRKGRLMVAAVERLIGNPGKYTSIADAAAQAQAEDSLIEAEEPSSSWLNLGLRPGIFRTKSSKGSAPNSQPSSAAGSQNNSRTPSRAASPEPMSPDSLRSDSTLQSPASVGSTESSPFGSTENVAALGTESGPPPPPKRPGMRRTATYTFDARSNPKGKVVSTSVHSRREQKQIIRERLAAIAHKSLSMRNVQISVESEPDAKGHRKRRTFWTETDDAGRFSEMCPVHFRPDRVRINSGAAVAFTGCIFVPRSGVSVISDIDDTVRHTGVTKSKRELLQNVLVKNYDDCRIDGVREWFIKMAEAGATFHYVSNSPWQLFDVIHGYLRHHKFPEGSIHLKKYAGVFDGLTEQAKGRKRATLEKIMRDFPERKFILIGDSGEADLEAYSELTRKFPQQVLAIYIRDITIPPDEPLYDPRAHTTHRRHHSADLVTMDTPPELLSRSPQAPTLPPRRRRPPSDLPPLEPLVQSPQEPATDTMNAIVDSAQQGEMPSAETTSERTIVPELPSPDATRGHDHQDAAEGKSLERDVDSCTHAVSNGTADDIAAPALPSRPGVGRPPNDIPAIKTTPSSDSAGSTSHPPKLPARPKLLRRTSSKLFDSVTAVASASSHAVNSAAKLLGPHHQNGSQGSLSTPGQTVKSKPKSTRMAKLSIGDESSEQKSANHRKVLSGSSASSNASTTSSSSRHTPASPASPHVQAEVNDSGVFVTSSQDFVDVDRVDKRAEHWKMRLVKQHRLLPEHVELKAWRQPKDIEAQSLRIIKGDKSLI